MALAPKYIVRRTYRFLGAVGRVLENQIRFYARISSRVMYGEDMDMGCFATLTRQSARPTVYRFGQMFDSSFLGSSMGCGGIYFIILEGNSKY